MASCEADSSFWAYAWLMKLTAALFEAFLKCPTKCYLLSTGQSGSGNAYADWVREQNDDYRKEAVQRLVAAAEDGVTETTPGAEDLKTATWRFALDLALETETMASRLDAVERVPSEGRGRPAQFIPVCFTFFNKITKDDRWLVAFDALILSEALGRGVSMGKIIHGDDHATLKVKVPSLLETVRKLSAKMSAMLSAASPPDLILNRHCGECEFRDGCRQKAVEKDDLSLLAGMSEKERKGYHSKGIFTVTQLSYTFRPRRRPKRLRDKREKYHHSLKALAIREKKIYIVGSPEIKIEGTPVYLDVEGIPDRDFHYLIGVQIGNGEAAIQHSLWADTIEEEGKIWQSFLCILETVLNPVLIHYGSYETTFFRQMKNRHNGTPEGSLSARVIGSAVNLVSLMFATTYFPTLSNGLKEIAGWLGYSWKDNWPSGLHSIRWRHQWEQTRQGELKERLLKYNSDDCAALEHATKALLQAHHPPLSPSDAVTALDIAQADTLSSQETMWPRFASPIEAFESINKAGRWDYQRHRIYIRTNHEVRRATIAARIRRKRVEHVNKDVLQDHAGICPQCLKRSGIHTKTRTKTLYDVRFTEFGIRRWVVRYHIKDYHCPTCHRCFGTPKAFWQQGKYGRNLIAFVVYQVIELCIPQHTVGDSMNRLFRFGLGQCLINSFKASAAQHYEQTRQTIIAKMVKGCVIHADETRIVLKGKPAYVWVFANFSEVAYFYSDSREGDLLQKLLKDFQGVLVSDFYAAYDSMPCSQQKCLIHLMRDLNDAVLEQPFDEEVRGIVTEFGEILRSIVATIDQRGLKRRFLRKHGIEVERFYRHMRRTSYHSDAALKCRERFEKNREKLFTFLNHDGVPWNNNNVEHAIKAFARLRRAIEGLSTPKGIEEYLILLSICQTCKCTGVDFLDFLRSGEKDVHVFAENRRSRRRRSPTNEPKALPADEGTQK